MDLKEIFAKLNSGEVAAHSELGTRDESKQSRNFGSRISKMKTVTGINARAMVMKDVVIPFNPFTGKTDEVYTKATPFRPILLVSQVLGGLKEAMASNPDMKAFWEKELGIAISEGAPTMEEYIAFKKAGYVKPRVMSYPTVAMNFNGAHGFPDFKVKYLVDGAELNAEGTYDYQTGPVWHKAAAFFNAMLKKEADEVVKNLEANGANKDAIKTQRGAVYQKAPVSFVAPTNLVPFLFIPLNELPPNVSADNFMDIEKHMRYYSFTDKWITALKEAMTDPVYDEDMDFFDFTIKTPTSQDRQSNGKVYTDEDANAIYQALTITTTDGRVALHSGSTSVNGQSVKNEECFAPLIAAAHRYFIDSQEQSGIEGGKTFEKIMSASSRFRPITQAMDNFLPACNDVFSSVFASTKYFTEDIKRGNSEFYVMMNPQNAVGLAAVDEEELEEAAAAAKKGISDLISEATGRVGVDTERAKDMEMLGIKSTDAVSELEFAD